jgi:hypothetical protein
MCNCNEQPTTGKPHPHAELIKQWADGAVIQVHLSGAGHSDWFTADTPSWKHHLQYRVKPQETDLQKYGVEVGDVWEIHFNHRIYLVTEYTGSSFMGRNLSNGCNDRFPALELKILKFRRGVVNKL